MTQQPELVVEGAAGQQLTLPVGGGPATGYEWFLELPDGVRSVTPDAAADRDNDRGADLGDPTGVPLAVVADTPGDYVVRADLARPWERERPIRSVAIRLRVG